MLQPVPKYPIWTYPNPTIPYTTSFKLTQPKQT